MAFKPNYKQQRAERDRAKRAKKADKVKLQQERVALRKDGRIEPADNTGTDSQK
jgi:hypothetical protein